MDCIELLLPLKAEYVSLARLAVSGVANRMGFDIETIEDIKVALAEVCNKLVQKGSNSVQSYKIVFNVSVDKLNIVFDCEDKSLRCIFEGEGEKLGVSIINALMDEVEFCSNNSYLMSMSIALKGDS
ncbi:MAG: ATP-binding protein [Clostridia bacterium]|nr:ATP-binding protein [Clostridia bacterium]